jgi:hypothetical protein
MRQQAGQFFSLVVCVKAGGPGINLIMVKEPRCPSGVFRGNQRHLSQDAQGAYGDVLEVANRRRDEIKSAGHPVASVPSSFVQAPSAPVVASSFRVGLESFKAWNR